jgi:hypothetical protein
MELFFHVDKFGIGKNFKTINMERKRGPNSKLWKALL